MPARRISEGEREIYEDIRARYPQYLTVTQVSELLGYEGFEGGKAWLADVPATLVGKRNKYSARAIARKLWRDTGVSA